MKTKTTITAVFGAVLVAIGVTAVVLLNQPATKNDKTITASQPEQQVTTNPNIVEFKAEKGKDVLAQLKTHATVTTKDSQYGPYVDSINGIKGGTDGKYWAFYVNDSLAQKGAADYITDGTETITWKFE